jgi:cytochrome b
LAISFAGAWLTSEGEAQQMIHYAFGYSACALVLFRIVWGVVGTRYARFTEFVRGPAETMHHIKSLFKHDQAPRLGHNPVGALVMISLMILVLLIGLTGFWSVKDFLGEYMTGAHEVISNLALGFVAIHVIAAVIMSFLQKENLVKSMIVGTKQGAPEQAIRYPMYLVGLCLLIAWAYSFYLVAGGSLQSLTQ